jgi:hypothetical protein
VGGLRDAVGSASSGPLVAPAMIALPGQIAENQKVTQRARLQALAAIVKPSLSLLLRLLNNTDTPARLMELAAKRRQTEMIKRQLRKRARQSTQDSLTDN